MGEVVGDGVVGVLAMMSDMVGSLFAVFPTVWEMMDFVWGFRFVRVDLWAKLR